MKNVVVKIFLFILSFPILSRVWGVLAKIEKPAVIIKKLIRFYKKSYGIDMIYYKGDVEDYKSLSEFFIREIDQNVRPLVKNKDAFLSPSDGKITVLETLSEDAATQVKGKSYNVTEFVGEDIDFSKKWVLMTIYLSPKDYHRFHTPLDVNVESYLHTGSSLYPVNRLSVNSISDLFIKNERISVKMNYEGKSFYYVAVGATFVGSIKFNFIENLEPGKIVKIDREYKQNDEIGRFEMGSTIVLVLPEEIIDTTLVREGASVKAGNILFNLKR